MGVPLTKVMGKKNPDQDNSKKKNSDLALVDNTTSVGVEIEMENLGTNYMNRGNIPGWDRKSDGSLRGTSREFVFTQPLRGDSVIAALEELSENFDDRRFERHKNLRTSMHIHVNMLSLDRQQLIAVLLAATLADDAIFKKTEENRQFLGFARKSEDTLLTAIATLSQASDETIGISNIPYIGRYFSMNTAAISKYGTLEFRHFSTPNDVEEAVRMINLCLNVKKCGLLAWEAAGTDQVRNTPEAMYHLVREQVEAAFGNEHEMLTVEQFLNKLELAQAEVYYEPHQEPLNIELQQVSNMDTGTPQQPQTEEASAATIQNMLDTIGERFRNGHQIEDGLRDSLLRILTNAPNPYIFTVEVWQWLRWHRNYAQGQLDGHCISTVGNTLRGTQETSYYVIEANFVGNAINNRDTALREAQRARSRERMRQTRETTTRVVRGAHALPDYFTVNSPSRPLF